VIGSEREYRRLLSDEADQARGAVADDLDGMRHHDRPAVRPRQYPHAHSGRRRREGFRERPVRPRLGRGNHDLRERREGDGWRRERPRTQILVVGRSCGRVAEGGERLLHPRQPFPRLETEGRRRAAVAHLTPIRGLDLVRFGTRLDREHLIMVHLAHPFVGFPSRRGAEITTLSDVV